VRADVLVTEHVARDEMSITAQWYSVLADAKAGVPLHESCGSAATAAAASDVHLVEYLNGLHKRGLIPASQDACLKAFYAVCERLSTPLPPEPATRTLTLVVRADAPAAAAAAAAPAGAAAAAAPAPKADVAAPAPTLRAAPKPRALSIAELLPSAVVLARPVRARH